MDPVSRRAHIVEAAERLLRQHGWQKTTVGDIAREARVGVGTVYLEFANKDAVVEAVSASRYELVLRGMMEASTRPRLTHAQRLTGMMDVRVHTLLRLKTDGEHAMELMHCGCPGVEEAKVRFHAQEEALVARLLAAADHDGEFQVEDASLTARALLRAYLGFSPPWLFMEPEAQIRPLLAAVHALVLDGLQRRRARGR
jgi:AcrR family transcriptional regulator